MPTYDYECDRCHQTAEIFFQSWKNEKPPICVHCNFVMRKVFLPSRTVRKDKVNGLVFPQDGLTLEHLPGGAKHFDSYRDMKAYAKKHDLGLSAIL